MVTTSLIALPPDEIPGVDGGAGVNFMVIIPDSVKKDWLHEENKRLQEGKRQYLHFDLRITSLNKKISRYIWMSDHIVRHSFYPFICREKIFRKYKKVPNSKKKEIKEKIRPISYAGHFDSIIYSWYGHILSYFYENKIKDLEITNNVTGYRKLGKSNLDFAKVITNYAKDKGDCGIICFDLEKFFDTLDHGLLKGNWENVLGVQRLPDDHYAIFKNITKFSYINYGELIDSLGISRKDFDKLKRICEPDKFRKLRDDKKFIIHKNYKKNGAQGIPQGSTISAILSNVYMLDFDQRITMFLNNVGGFYQRYSDDIIIICPTDLIDKVEKEVEKLVGEIKLKVNPTKTEKLVYRTLASGKHEVIDFISGKKSNLQYLGVQFNGEDIFLRHSGIANFQRKMVRTVKKLAQRVKRKNKPFPKKQILKRFYYSKQQNYLAYANRASTILDSSPIKKQTAKHKVIRKINKAINKFF